MPFPDDLSNVVLFKIHPAIGIARLAKGDSYFAFGTDPGSYKESNGALKRQAVKFRIFAYRENHIALGELTVDVMQRLNIQAVWKARVANRKLARIAGTPMNGDELVISAEASSNQNGGRLVGSLPGFVEGREISLGEILPDGTFVPPKARVFRRNADSEIEDYPANTLTDVADNTCDGLISVQLTGADLIPEVLPACIVVSPQDFSPDKSESRTLLDHLKDKLQIPSTPSPGNVHNLAARQLDEAALIPGTSIFIPGVEIAIDSQRTEVPNLRTAFYDASTDSRVDPREIRVRYKAASGEPTGIVPGQLTSGLCSTWQGDYEACIGFWAEHLPDTSYLDENTQTEVRTFRKIYSNHSPAAATLSTGEEVEASIEKMGIVRLRNFRDVETERNPGDNA